MKLINVPAEDFDWQVISLCYGSIFEMMKSCFCISSFKEKVPAAVTQWVQSYQNYTTIQWQLCSIYVQMFFLFVSNDDDALSVIWNPRNRKKNAFTGP